MTVRLKEINQDELYRLMKLIADKITATLDENGFDKTCFTVLVYDNNESINIMSNNAHVKDIIDVLEEETQILYDKLRTDSSP